MDNLKLIYVLSVGENWEGKNVYQFIFSNTTDNIDGDEWDTYPASGRPSIPHNIHIKGIGELITDILFDVIQDSDTFCVLDALDGIMPLAWENIDEYDEYPNKRIYFRFGDDIKVVKDILHNKDITLDIKEVNK